LRIQGIDRQRTNRRHALVLKERLPGCAAVIGAKNPAVGGAYIKNFAVPGNARNRSHAPARNSRPDLPEADTLAHHHRQLGAAFVVGLLRTRHAGKGHSGRLRERD
jgi:hypothetical protein